LKKHLGTFRRKSKAHHWGQHFPTELMPCEEYEGERRIFVIKHHATEKGQRLNNITNGTCQIYVKEHLNLNVKLHFIAYNYVQCLRQAIVFFVLKDFYTGGVSTTYITCYQV
jgi:hypothetical protein